MTALVAPYAYFTQDSVGHKWALFLFSIPIAMLSNIVRIVTIAVAAEAGGREFAMTLYHDYSGYIVFAAATLMVILAGQLLKTHPKVLLRKWAAG